MAALDSIMKTSSRARDLALVYVLVVLLAIIVFVAFLPFIRNGAPPQTFEEWTEVVAPTAIAVIAATIAIVIDNRGRRQRTKLAKAYEDLRVSVASGLIGDENLRVSVASGLIGDERLRQSVAEGKVGDEKLAASVASGLVGDENLRIAVASGLVGDENLRIAVASGLAGDENLRASVASGLVGDENLRLAVASGLEGDENLRIALASGLVGDENLRIALASGLVGDEKLRVSVADGIDGAEALRVSIAQGIDAASTALAVVDTVDAAITFYDPNGVILLTNDTARRLADLAQSQQLNPLVFEDDRVTPIPRIDQVLARAARGQLVTRRSYWVGTGDAQRAMMSTSQYVRRKSGELLGTVVATHDVTALAAAIRSRDEFLETVSHELRTPLTSMIGYLEIIEDTLDVAAVGISHEFEVVQRNSLRLLKLITDLLLTAEGEASVERRSFDIAELATNSLNSIRPAAVVAGIRVLPPQVTSVLAEVDADRIGDVFDKILSNALKFNQAGGTVSLSVMATDTEAVVRISDTGLGMDEADQKHIFERFFRSSVARTGVVPGAGLGLSTAKLIVDSHRGAITVESVIGEGTTIEVRLPIVA